MTNKKLSKEKHEFEISSPKWMRNFFIVCCILSFLPIIIVGILELLGLINNIVNKVSLVLGIFAVIGLLGLYTYYTEKFSYIDGVYYYNKPFKKNQQTKSNLIDHVELRLQVKVQYMDVIFFDVNNKKLINFYDDGTAFRDDLFLNSLEYNKIPYYLVDNIKDFNHQELIEVINELLEYFKINRNFISLNIYDNQKPFVIAIKTDLYIMLDVKKEGYAISINTYENDVFTLIDEIEVINVNEIFETIKKLYLKYISE